MWHLFVTGSLLTKSQVHKSVVSNSNCWSSSNYILQGKWDQVGPSAIKRTRLVPATKITQDVAFRLWEMFILLLTWFWLSSSWQELRIFRQYGDYNTSLPDVQWQEGAWSTAEAGCDKKGFNNTTYFLQKGEAKVFKSHRKFVNDALPAPPARPRWAPRTSTPSPSLTSRWTPLYLCAILKPLYSAIVNIIFQTSQWEWKTSTTLKWPNRESFSSQIEEYKNMFQLYDKVGANITRSL